jgi:Mrp family chromosome partitioning ATPase
VSRELDTRSTAAASGLPDDPQQSFPLRTTASEGQDDGWVDSRSDCPVVEIEGVTLRRPLDSRLVILSEPTSTQARSYRLLRHKLFSHCDCRIVAITSACPGDGKTTCALNLALALAEDSLTRVLLLDANLRRPAIAQVLELSPCESLVETMTRLAYAGSPYPVVTICGTRLHVAALSEAPHDGGRLDRMLLALALAQLRRTYDYIVIDAASVLETGDVDVIGECSDGVIVTARAGRSRRGDVRRALAQLDPAPVLGVVLIDA